MRCFDYLISTNRRPSSPTVEHEIPVENTESVESKNAIRHNYNLVVSIFTWGGGIEVFCCLQEFL